MPLMFTIKFSEKRCPSGFTGKSDIFYRFPAEGINHLLGGLLYSELGFSLGIYSEK